MTDQEMLQRWMTAQEGAIRDLTARLDLSARELATRQDALEARVGMMAAKIDRFDATTEKLDDLVNALGAVHKAAEIITRGKRFWAKVVGAIAGFLIAVDAIARVILPVLGRLFG